MGKGTFSCVKWLLTVFNVIFLICGLAVCSIAIWMFVSPSMAHEVIGRNLTPIIAYVLLSCGSVIVLISFCGCAGAGLENRCLLCLFFTVLCGIFVACLVTSILVSIFRKDLSNLTSNRLSTNLKANYGDPQSQALTDFWDFVQSNFSCCGVGNTASPSSIYQYTPWYQTAKPSKVPISCCNKSPTGIFVNLNLCQMGNKIGMFNDGCIPAITKILMDKYLILLGIIIALAVVLILGMALSLAHLRNIINIRYHLYSHPL